MKYFKTYKIFSVLNENFDNQDLSENTGGWFDYISHFSNDDIVIVNIDMHIRERMGWSKAQQLSAPYFPVLEKFLVQIGMKPKTLQGKLNNFLRSNLNGRYSAEFELIFIYFKKPVMPLLCIDLKQDGEYMFHTESFVSDFHMFNVEFKQLYNLNRGLYILPYYLMDKYPDASRVIGIKRQSADMIRVYPKTTLNRQTIENFYKDVISDKIDYDDFIKIKQNYEEMLSAKTFLATNLARFNLDPKLLDKFSPKNSKVEKTGLL